MMKKKISAALLACIMLLTGSCSQKKETDSADALISAIVNDISSEAPEAYPESQPAAEKPTPESSSQQTEESTKPVSLPEEKTTATPADSGAPVDIDMTQMSATMIYATVNDMLTVPENYYGKTVRVDGFFDMGTDESIGATYFFVVIPDATACCLQGMEFRRSNGSTDPADYPEVKDDIRISGTYDRYEENGNLYYYIKADEVTVL